MPELSGDKGHIRITRIENALRRAELDAVLVTLPANVRMLSGLDSITSPSIAIASSKGEIAILVPEGKLALAEHSRVDRIRGYKGPEELGSGLRSLLHDMELHCSHIGYESKATGGPFDSPEIIGLLRIAAPSAPLAPADDVLRDLRRVLRQPL
ncbi:MAG TPA: aminopeptidase P family N-terminal domain-containing protein [Terriglobales bacterium]|nr:aminopeptidase P family N-terminal domain-containing protein [Terriglobales bacterium]